MNSTVLDQAAIDTIVDVLRECKNALEGEDSLLQDEIVEALRLLGDYTTNSEDEDEE